VPYVLTHAIQDDAFITWRCAVQLADTGVYGFNPGERVSASTSHAYVGMVALLRLVFHGEYIPATLAINTVLTVSGLFFVADCLSTNARVRDACWVLSSLTPLALIVSTTGMETALLVFALALALWGLERSDRAPWYALVALGALPLIRLDAVFASGVIGLTHAWRSRRVFGEAALATLAGVGAVVAFNALYFGVVLNQSIVAKLHVAESALGPREVIRRVIGVYFTTSDTPSAFMPLPTKYLTFTGALFAAASFAGFAVMLRREARGSGRAAAILALAIIGLVTPAIYAAVAVMYPWYFWPSVLLSGVALLSLALESSFRAGARAFAFVSGALGLCDALAGASQWALSFSAGVREHDYVASVGQFLAASGHAGDTLFSDMAGSIPYFSGLVTYDDAGLVSPLVTRYEATRGDAWQASFVREQRPTWIALRDPLDERLDAAAPRDANGTWVLANYDLVKHFQYVPRDFVSNATLLRIAQMGSASEFFVYRLRDE